MMAGRWVGDRSTTLRFLVDDAPGPTPEASCGEPRSPGGAAPHQSPRRKQAVQPPTLPALPKTFVVVLSQNVQHSEFKIQAPVAFLARLKALSSRFEIYISLNGLRLTTITLASAKNPMPISCYFANCSCPSWTASMDESALRKALASLDDCGASLHLWLKVSTALVVVGVALEVVFVIWEYVVDLHEFKRGIVRPPDKPSWLLFGLGFLGAALVSVGVGGELYAESRISTLETCIRSGNDALSRLLSKEAGDAAASAKSAHDEADAVGSEADAIDKRLDKASSRVAKLVTALRQPSLSDKDVKQIREELANCPNRNTAVLVRFVFTNRLGIPVFNALREAGFTKVELKGERTPWIGASVHGPLASYSVTDCIAGALIKHVTIWGTLGISDPPGSPVTISLGDTPIGELPK